MAEINIERKNNMWTWVIGLIVVLLLIWGAFALFGDDDADTYVAPMGAYSAPADSYMAPAAAVVPAADPIDQMASSDNPRVTIAATPPPPTAADNEAIQVATITLGPASFYGNPVVGTARVESVPTDRGFWIEVSGARMFALIAQSPNMEDAIDVNSGQQLRLSGVVYPTSMSSQIENDLDDETQQILSNEAAFLLVNANNIMIIETNVSSP